MPYAIGKTATIRDGKIISGGTEFEVSVEEIPALQAAGFEILPDSPKSGNINIPTEVETNGRAGNIPEKTSGIVEGVKEKNSKAPSNEVTKPMGGSSSKAKMTSTATSKKEGQDGKLENAC